MDFSPDDWIQALTITLAQMDQKQINASDLQENGVIPTILHGNQVEETVHQNRGEADIIMQRLGIDGVIRYPSVQMLNDIHDMPDRPFFDTTWNSVAIELAKAMLGVLAISLQQPGSRTVYDGIRIEEDTREVTREILMDGSVLPPQMITLLVTILTDTPWQRWPKEHLVSQLLHVLVDDHEDKVKVSMRQDSSRVTLRAVDRQPMLTPLTPSSSRCYTPIPDLQIRSSTVDNIYNGALLSSLEVDSKARRADRYTSDLLVNGSAKAYRLRFARSPSNPDFLFTSIFVNYAEDIIYSTSIGIFEVFPKEVNIEDSIVRSRYDTSAGLPGALQFFHVMQKLVYRQIQYLRENPGFLDTFASTIALYEPQVKAATNGALTAEETTTSTSHSDVQDPFYRLKFSSLHGELEKIVVSLSCEKRKALLLQEPEANQPFAVAKLVQEQEVALTEYLQSIVGVVKVVLTQRLPHHFILCTEYAGGELSWYCAAGPSPSIYPAPMEVARGVVGTILAIHRAGVAHRDIKPANICIPRRSPEGPAAIIIDFNISLSLNDSNPIMLPFGTKGWRAPEVEQRDLSKVDLVAADIWAVGNVLLYIHKRFSSRVPLEDVGNAMVAYEPSDRLSLEDALSRLSM